MARMTGLVETLVHNLSPPPLLTDAEHANVLRAWRRADDASATLRTVGDIAAAQDEDSGSDPARDPCNSHRRRNAPAQKSATRSGEVRLPTDHAGPSRPRSKAKCRTSPAQSLIGLALCREISRRAHLHVLESAPKMRDFQCGSASVRVRLPPLLAGRPREPKSSSPRRSSVFGGSLARYLTTKFWMGILHPSWNTSWRPPSPIVLGCRR